jgi:hypothetical protein
LQVVDEDGYVIRVKDNALIVLVPKYGIEVCPWLPARRRTALHLHCIAAHV